MDLRDAEHPRPSRTLIHLSDTHLRAEGARLYDRVDPTAQLIELLAALEGTGRRPDAIVVTGDLADLGERQAYRDLAELVEPVAERLGARLVWAMGNHDDRGALREHLLGEAPTMAPIDRVDELEGLRIVTLDTTVPGAHHGEVGVEQLAWLADVLAQPAPLGTVLAMHHPPVPSPLDLAASVELRDQAALAYVLAGTDVRAILAGHLHYSSFATFAGIPVSVASASCYTQDLLVPAGGTRGRDGARAFNLVEVYPTTITHSVVPVERTEALSYVSRAESERMLADIGMRIRDAETGSMPLVGAR